MDINIKDIKDSFEFNYKLTDNNFSLDSDSTAKIKDNLTFTGEIKKFKNEVLLLNFTINGVLIHPCSRCLEDVETEIDYDFNEEIQADSDDIVRLDSYASNILFLNEPMHILCKEDCKGLCPVCGKNLNYGQCDCQGEEEIDPRLEVLKNLL